MRRFAVVLLVIGFAQVSAFGGVISFDPSPVDVNVPGGDSPLVTLDVFLGELGSIGDEFGAFDVVFGSGLVGFDAVGLGFVDFVFDPALVALFPPSVLPDPAPTVYLDSIQIGMFLNQFPPFGPVSTGLGPVRIGGLTVDTTLLPLGSYEVIVDFGLDNTSLAAAPGGNSFLSGTGFVNVIPEPATITLLGLASLALIRRRRKA